MLLLFASSSWSRAKFTPEQLPVPAKTKMKPHLSSAPYLSRDSTISILDGQTNAGKKNIARLSSINLKCKRFYGQMNSATSSWTGCLRTFATRRGKCDSNESKGETISNRY